MASAWYVLHTYSGHENKVKINLEQRIRAMGKMDSLYHVVLSTGLEFIDDLNNGKIPESLIQKFKESGIPISENPSVLVQENGNRWLLSDNKQNYIIRKDGETLNVYASQIIVPTQEVTEIKGGKKRIVSKISFPGYVLVKMDLDDELWYIVKNTPGVMGFVGTSTHPTPLDDQEVENIIKGKLPEKEESAKRSFEFVIGDKVKVVDGPFTGFSGIVDDINEEKNKLKIMISIFGRSTPVELEFFQVEKSRED
ncbi:MAG: transcription termination/antitermination protein NusG [bacterium]